MLVSTWQGILIAVLFQHAVSVLWVFFLFHVRTCLFETSMSFISTRSKVGMVGEASRKTHCPQVACHEAYTSREGFQWRVLLKRLSHCENEQIWVKMCVFFWPFQDELVTEMCIYDCSYQIAGMLDSHSQDINLNTNKYIIIIIIKKKKKRNTLLCSTGLFWFLSLLKYLEDEVTYFRYEGNEKSSI